MKKLLVVVLLVSLVASFVYADASKKTQYKVKVDKQSVYNALKADFPTFFGAYNWTDVEYFGDDPKDNSYLLWIMNEEDL